MSRVAKGDGVPLGTTSSIWEGYSNLHITRSPLRLAVAVGSAAHDFQSSQIVSTSTSSDTTVTMTAENPLKAREASKDADGERNGESLQHESLARGRRPSKACVSGLGGIIRRDLGDSQSARRRTTA